jgi:alkylation response protein AidB-like acyl-CoA dehydrogenase
MAMPVEAPLAAQRLAIEQACRASGLSEVPSVRETVAEVADTVLESAGRFARDVLSPLNPIGDRTPTHLEAGHVVTPPGFKEAYRRFCADGWTSVNAPAQYGGQGLPHVISAAPTEMWASANLSFAMCPELTVGVVAALQAHASAALCDQYLPLLIQGELTATMCLTEPQAGSDLAGIRARAEADGDAWRLFGRKIFISWGDHDLAENIVHLVLARMNGAPQGVQGLSLFLVPKILRTANQAERNDIDVLALEHKMGIRSSATCALALGERGGARGWLVGEPNAGLACMFTVMNLMRLGVGLHSVGLAERALQLARAYASTRQQGRSAAGPNRPIIEHADVRRMLLTMKALVHAARCLAYTAAACIDLAHAQSLSDAERAAADGMASLLTPIVKAWVSDTAVEVSSLGVQVHGGMGYIDDCEASQIYRDARIGPIYEGTNFIQAQDLIGRKIQRDQGATLERLLAQIERDAMALPAAHAGLGALRAQLLQSVGGLRSAARMFIERGAVEPDLIGTVGYHFLQWIGVTCGGWQWALTAGSMLPRAGTDAQARALVDTASFYGAHVMPRTTLHEAIVTAGAAPVSNAALTEL